MRGPGGAGGAGGRSAPFSRWTGDADILLAAEALPLAGIRCAQAVEWVLESYPDDVVPLPARVGCRSATPDQLEPAELG